MARARSLMGFRGVNSVLRWGIAALLILGFALPALSSEAPVVTVDVHAARKLVGSDHKYLDVRTVEEFKKGHPESSLNVPYLFFTPDGRVKNPYFVEQVAAVCNKDDHIVVGCLSGVRSLQATSDLLKAGFKHVKNVGGGYEAWVENGFRVNVIQDEL